MCGIVGLFLKNEALQPKLGSMLTDMLVTMSDRGPDSAGVAIYGSDEDGVKITVQSHDPERAFEGLDTRLGAAIEKPVSLKILDTHAVASVPVGCETEAIAFLEAEGLRVMGSGRAMEIFKEVGLPDEVAARFDLRKMSGTHGIGHTRMATESAVTTDGAHPYSTAEDECLVHNGSLSNHNGASLGEALEGTLEDLDGFFTFVMGTRNGFGVVRDPIACKPAVMAETEDYVAFGSEYRAFADLPGIDAARIWEPEPATVYFWER